MIVTIALLVFIVVREYLYQRERKGLVEMIMAKSLPEFKEAEKEKKGEPTVDVPPELIPMDNATDEQFNLAIKKQLGREPMIEKVKEKLRRKNRGE